MTQRTYPIGSSKEALAFISKESHNIKGFETNIDYDLEEKTIVYKLFDGTKVEFTFPFSDIFNS